MISGVASLLCCRDARIPPLQNAAFGALRDVGSFSAAAESMAVVGGVPFILGVIMEDLSAVGSAQVCSVFNLQCRFRCHVCVLFF